MKKQLLIITLAVSVIVSACQKAPKTEATVGAKEELKFELNTKTNDALQLRMDLIKYPPDVQKAFFNSLNPHQKAMIWENKLDQAISYAGWNEYQVQLLNELKDNISPDLYSNNATLFRDQVQPEWLERAKGQFVFDDLMKIVSVLDDYTPGIIVGGGGTSNKKDCNCSVKSDWCSTALHQSCQITNGCNDSAHGCGTLWVYGCKGECKL
ncbi:MAG: hypothetical protein JWO44_1034 [Bacteroidetes bacterium]|nr:hypothetical protein [Bacteroidota bacterium]